jgi:hypothetical protein
MRIVVNHLTRMRKGGVCAAGLDLSTRCHVRPVLPAGQLGSHMLARHRGPLDMAVLVELGEAGSAGTPPHVEDHLFEWWLAWRVEDLAPRRFWRMLQAVAGTRVSELFGPELQPLPSGACAAPQGAGRASLGCLVPVGSPQLSLHKTPGGAQIRLSLADGEYALNLSVTDARLYLPDLQTPDAERVNDAAKRLERGVPSILSLGLTRPFAKAEGAPPMHWLQVNNIHLEDDPAWRLA